MNIGNSLCFNEITTVSDAVWIIVNYSEWMKVGNGLRIVALADFRERMKAHIRNQ